jgi:hypothetical protein
MGQAKRLKSAANGQTNSVTVTLSVHRFEYGYVTLTNCSNKVTVFLRDSASNVYGNQPEIASRVGLTLGARHTFQRRIEKHALTARDLTRCLPHSTNGPLWKPIRNLLATLATLRSPVHSASCGISQNDLAYSRFVPRRADLWPVWMCYGPYFVEACRPAHPPLGQPHDGG